MERAGEQCEGTEVEYLWRRYIIKVQPAAAGSSISSSSNSNGSNRKINAISICKWPKWAKNVACCSRCGCCCCCCYCCCCCCCSCQLHAYNCQGETMLLLLLGPPWRSNSCCCCISIYFTIINKHIANDLSVACYLLPAIWRCMLHAACGMQQEAYAASCKLLCRQID